MAVSSIRLQVLQGKDFCQFYLPLYFTLVPGKKQILNKRSRKEPSTWKTIICQHITSVYLFQQNSEAGSVILFYRKVTVM